MENSAIMPRKKNTFPNYPTKPHKSGHARISVHGRDYYLGPWGSPESRQRYAQIVAQLADGGVVAGGSKELTVDGLLDLWEIAAANRYQNGSREPAAFKAAAAPVRRLYGSAAAKDFDARALKTVRSAMVNGTWLDESEKAFRQRTGGDYRWSRQYTNQQCMRIRMIWRWAESEGLVPPGLAHNLKTLPPLDRNVRQTKPREPVAWAHVEAILPHVSPVIRALILCQWHTGARPSELTQMRPTEIDRTGDVWVYRPEKHKNQWRGQGRAILLGPEAQTAIAPWIDAALQPGSKGWVFPSSRRGKQECYITGYSQAIKRGCKAAGVPHFSAYQLRHSAKARVTREYGLDAARAFLGQKSLEATNGYAAQQDLETAAKVARKVG